jgi:Dynamin family
VATAASTARPGPLCRRVAALCGSIGFSESHLNDQLASLTRALSEPLRVAFAGRVSMGKSTLVNALLQAPVAPMGDRETTKVVTRFEAGDFEDVELRLRDGSARQTFLTPDGVLPPTYPVSSEKIQEVRVRLPYAPLLQRMTLIDTPGLESLNAEASSRTSESLFSRDSRDAIAGADALVYLMRTGTEDDAAAVAAFNELTAVDLCALNAVGVLNCKTEHSLSEQDRVARRLKGEPAFHNKVADVIPVAGLLAYAAGSALLNDCDAAHLRCLATYDTDDLLIDVDEFLEAPCDVTRDERQRLLDLLGFPGLRIALQTVRSSPGRLADINAALLSESGLPRLLRAIDGTFASCADQIKAGQTLVAVTRLSYQADAASGHRARVMIETLRADPGMHGIQELWALQQCALPEMELPEWVVAELTRAAAGATPGAKTGLPDDAGAEEILEAARAGASRAHSYAAGLSVTRPEVRVAETLRRSYTNIYRDAAGHIENRS